MVKHRSRRSNLYGTRYNIDILLNEILNNIFSNNTRNSYSLVNSNKLTRHYVSKISGVWGIKMKILEIITELQKRTHTPKNCDCKNKDEIMGIGGLWLCHQNEKLINIICDIKDLNE